MNFGLENTIQKIEEEIKEYKNYTTDSLEDLDFIQSLIEILEKGHREIVEEDNICLRCKCHKKHKSWEENRPYGDGFVPERLSAYYCPICKEED